MRVSFASNAVALLLVTSGARAAEPEITSDTTAQFYDVRSPTGETILARRRVTTTLGVSVYDLADTPRDPMGPTLSFRARMRYDADYGGPAAEADVTNYGRFVPGFDRGPIDLMYGYVEGRRYFRGWLGFKLGRQYTTDALGWWSFDGGLVKVTTPCYFAVEAYGGLEVRGGMPLSTGRFEPDGVWRGDRTGYDPSLYPSFQPSDVAPAFGAAIESAGITWIHGRLSYRRVENTGASSVAQFASATNAAPVYEGMRVSQERVGYALDATAGKIGGLKGGFAYDLYDAVMADAYASIDVNPTERVTVSVDYDYFKPTFDADSIWNFFQSGPMNDVGLRGAWEATDRVSLAAGAHARAFEQQTGPSNPNASPNLAQGPADPTYYPASAVSFDGGGNVAARYLWGEGTLGARGNGNFGPTGDRVGGDVYAERTIETRYVVSGRAGLWQWNDRLRPDRDAVSFGYVAGLGYKLAPRSSARMELQHDMNRLTGQRFRVMLWLTVAVAQ